MDLRKKTGRQGEDLARSFLEKQGYRILGHNLSSRHGEIDLVAQKKDRLFFIEVRRRVGSTFGSALDSITGRKISRIRKTAEYLLMKNKIWQGLIPFFSVIAIDENAGKTRIEFLQNAFE